MKCDNCNHELEVGAKFCRKCGHKVTSEIKAEEKAVTKETSSPVGRVISIVIFIIAIAVARYISQEVFHTSSSSNSSYSTSDTVNETVKQVKAKMTFPVKLDEVTTWLDITTESNALHYYYLLSDIDENKLTDEYLKNYVVGGVCKSLDTMNILNKNINMMYTYTIKDSTRVINFTVSKADCS